MIATALRLEIQKLYSVLKILLHAALALSALCPWAATEGSQLGRGIGLLRKASYLAEITPTLTQAILAHPIVLRAVPTT